MAITAAVTLITWSVAAVLWLMVGQRAIAVAVFGLGLSLGPCLAAYLLVRADRKQQMRRLVLVTGGLSILAFSLLGRANIDLEGFFMLLFAGTMGAAVGHTLVTVIVGPMIFGRVLCGWGCWRAMVLELLPLDGSPGRRGGAWALLPLVGLTASIGGAGLSFFVLGHHAGGVPGSAQTATLSSIAAAYLVYYAASIGLAFSVRDQRAFCKYLCPSGAILRFTSRPAMLRIAADGARCDGCGVCGTACPMDIDVARFGEAGRSIATGDCILCQRCAHACPNGALRLVFGSDRDRPRLRQDKSHGQTTTA